MNSKDSAKIAKHCFVLEVQFMPYSILTNHKTPTQCSQRLNVKCPLHFRTRDQQLLRRVSGDRLATTDMGEKWRGLLCPFLEDRRSLEVEYARAEILRPDPARPVFPFTFLARAGPTGRPACAVLCSEAEATTRHKD